MRTMSSRMAENIIMVLTLPALKPVVLLKSSGLVFLWWGGRSSLQLALAENLVLSRGNRESKLGQ